MLDFVTRTADLGTTEKLARKERKYQGQTVTDMRQDLIVRAQATIEALEAHTSGSLRAPMARSIRNGISIKIGYGKRNVGFFERQGDNRLAIIPELHFARDRKFLAIDYLQQAITAVGSGEFDALLSNTRELMAARFSKSGLEERQTPEGGLDFGKRELDLMLVRNAA